MGSGFKTVKERANSYVSHKHILTYYSIYTYVEST